MLTFFTSSYKPILSESKKYDIEEIYEGIDADFGTKVITTFGSLEDAETILVPSKLDVGTYKVNVTRKATNLYQIAGTQIYIETRYCYEYAYSEEVILDITGNYGYTKGELIFL